MKINLFLLASSAFLVSVLGDGWVLNPSGNTFGASQPARAVASTSVKIKVASDGLPDILPMMGSPEAFRNYIVSKNSGLGLMRFIFSLGYSLNGKWVEAQVAKDTYGFNSFTEALVDLTEGAQIALDMINSPESTYPEGQDVYALFTIWQFMDQPGLGINRIVLARVGNLGTRERVTVQRMLGVASSLDFDPDREVERAIVPVPDLSHVHIDVEKDGVVSTLDWWASTGKIQLANWPPETPKEQTTSGYLSINRWVAAGEYAVRITLEKRGARATYTQYGERLTPPSLKLHGTRNLEILGFARGSHVEIHASQDGKNWEPFTVNSNAVSSFLALPFIGPDQKMLFFKAVAR